MTPLTHHSFKRNVLNVKIFFLSCVLVAGLYGAATANRKILFIQAIPAAIGLVLMLCHERRLECCRETHFLIRS